MKSFSHTTGTSAPATAIMAEFPACRIRCTPDKRRMEDSQRSQPNQAAYAPEGDEGGLRVEALILSALAAITLGAACAHGSNRNRRCRRNAPMPYSFGISCIRVRQLARGGRCARCGQYVSCSYPMGRPRDLQFCRADTFPVRSARRQGCDTANLRRRLLTRRNEFERFRDFGLQLSLTSGALDGQSDLMRTSARRKPAASCAA